MYDQRFEDISNGFAEFSPLPAPSNPLLNELMTFRRPQSLIEESPGKFKKTSSQLLQQLGQDINPYDIWTQVSPGRGYRNEMGEKTNPMLRMNRIGGPGTISGGASIPRGQSMRGVR